MKNKIFLFSWITFLFGVINLEFAFCYKCRFSYEASLIFDREYSCIVVPDSDYRANNHDNGMTDNYVKAIILKADFISEHLTQSTFLPFCERFRNADRIMTNVKSFDENLFGGCNNLKKIEIVDSKIVNVPEKLFYKHSKLVKIFFVDNNLTTLPENVFINQKELKVLYLHYNQISCLPSNIFKSLTKLQYLNLEGNKIKSLNPNWFENLQSLTALNLVSNKIQELPKNVFVKLEKLKILNLKHNQLTTIHSDSFGKYKNLQNVHLFGNRINSIDEKLFNNTGIKIYMIKGVCTDMNNCINNYQPREESRKNIIYFKNFCFLNKVIIFSFNLAAVSIRNNNF